MDIAHQGHEVELTYRTSTDIPHLPTLHHIIQRFHDFLPRRLAIETVNLQNIDVGAQPTHTRIHSIEYVLPRQADLVHHFSVISAHSRNWWLPFGRNAEIAFTQDNYFVARDVVLLEGPADDFFRSTVRIYISLWARMSEAPCDCTLVEKPTVSHVFKPTL